MVAPFQVADDRDLLDVLVVSRVELQVAPVGVPLPPLELLQDKQQLDRAETCDLPGGDRLDVFQFHLAQDAGNANPEADYPLSCRMLAGIGPPLACAPRIPFVPRRGPPGNLIHPQITQIAQISRRLGSGKNLCNLCNLRIKRVRSSVPERNVRGVPVVTRIVPAGRSRLGRRSRRSRPGPNASSGW
ncbi:MAG: hypothetical protein MZV64_73650 [Ignavibacteriales bacterium]|nr:hypothetical protein [Ignavibacteriales bacterium]